jgi:phosphoribosylamine--glycine ligase
MGTVAPLSISDSLRQKIEEEIVGPSVRELEKRGLLYRGVLFIGVMITDRGPQVLEYNCRFGDPETQVILPLLKGDLGLIFRDLALGRMRKFEIKNLFASCVVMAAPGYPMSPRKSVAIEGDLAFEDDQSYFLHAGTKKSDCGWLTNGGRVLNAIGLGASLNDSLKNAYALSEKVHWKDQLKRSDIGKKQKSDA